MLKTSKAIAFVGAGLLAANSAQAAFTPVQAPIGEDSHAVILEGIFGVAFVADDVNFVSVDDSIVVSRVDDDADEVYSGYDSYDAEILGAHAFATQGFGTVADGNLITAIGQYSDASGALSGIGGGDTSFARFGTEFGTLDVSTVSADNPNSNDHVVTYTYSIDGEVVEDTWLLFFEDANETSPFPDFDYNDLVVEVVGVPEPGSLALIGLGGLAMLRRRR